MKNLNILLALIGFVAIFGWQAARGEGEAEYPRIVKPGCNESLVFIAWDNPPSYVGELEGTQGQAVLHEIWGENYVAPLIYWGQYPGTLTEYWYGWLPYPVQAGEYRIEGGLYIDGEYIVADTVYFECFDLWLPIVRR